MTAHQEAPAVAIARAHVEAWVGQDLETARNGLAADVRCSITSTSFGQGQPTTRLNGVDAYMDGLLAHAPLIVPGSLRFLSGEGDERNALLMLAYEVDFGTGDEAQWGARAWKGKATLPVARLYALDDDNKIKSEDVIYYLAGR